MVTMENSEETLQILERYTRLKQKEIPKELEDYLEYVAKTGDTVFKWSSLKYLFREKLLHVIKNFNEDSPRLEEIPNYPNVDPFNYEAMKSSLLERLDLFNAAPFTIQRLCELLIEPRKQYTRIDKYMRALEKNILVVSTVEPGRKRAESENGDSLDSVVNGDLSLEVNIDIEMENEALFNNADDRNISGNAISPLKALNPRPDDDNVEPKAKKVKLSCSGKGIDDLDKAISAEDAEAAEAEARRVAKANLPETPDEPDEEEDEIYEPTPHAKMCQERAKLAERMEKGSDLDKFAEKEKKYATKSLTKDGDNDDDDEKVVEKQEIEKCEKEPQHEVKNEDEDETVRTAPIESEQIASPSPEREVVDVLGKLEEEESTDTKKKHNSNSSDNGDEPAEFDNALCAKEKAANDDKDAKPETETEIRKTAVTSEIETASKTNQLFNEIVESEDSKNHTKQDEKKDEKRASICESKALAKVETIEKPKTTKDVIDAKTEEDTEDKSTEPPAIIKTEAIAAAAAATVVTPPSPEADAENAPAPVPIETDEPPTLTAANESAAAEPSLTLAATVAEQTVDQVANAVPTDAVVITPSPADTTVNVADQPMDEEQQVSPNAVEEVVMAELNKDEPAGMEVDDTSQEAMDQ